MKIRTVTNIKNNFMEVVFDISKKSVIIDGIKYKVKSKKSGVIELVGDIELRLVGEPLRQIERMSTLSLTQANYSPRKKAAYSVFEIDGKSHGRNNVACGLFIDGDSCISVDFGGRLYDLRVGGSVRINSEKFTVTSLNTSYHADMVGVKNDRVSLFLYLMAESNNTMRLCVERGDNICEFSGTMM